MRSTAPAQSGHLPDPGGLFLDDQGGLLLHDHFQELRRLLRVENLIVIPTEPGDVVGHADGVVRFIDGDVVLANDYRIIDGRYRARLRRVLKRAGLEVVELPYRPEVGHSRGIPPATGCYINYLRAGRLIVLPHFRLPEDEEARRRVECCFPHSIVQSLDCCELSAEGGVLNCATWNVLSPDPVADPEILLTG